MGPVLAASWSWPGGVVEIAVEVRRFELLASSVRGKRSAGLSYTPGKIGL